MDLQYINLAGDTYSIDLSPSAGGSTKPEETFAEIYTKNGTYTLTPSEGSVFSGGSVVVDTPEDNNSFILEADYDSLDYEYAYDYFEDRAPVEVSGFCSALVSENLVGRNLDWLYNNDVSFIVRTPHTIGISGGLGYSYEKMEQGLTDNEKKIIPFYLQDGINSSGLFAEMNVIPYNNVSSVGSGDRVCAIMLVRYILDNYSNVDDALTGIASKEIYLPQALIEQGYGLHFLLADSTKFVVVELTENGLQRFNRPILTNFSLYGVSFNEDGSVYTNADVPTHLPTDMGINEYGTGLERWNILNDAEISTKEDMIDTMKSVSFSNAYTKELGSDFWYSEFVGGDYTIDTPTDSEGFVERINLYKEKWENRDRENPTVWITTHTAVYDLYSLTITLTSQEHNAESEIKLYTPLQGQQKDYNITENGTTIITPDSGYNAITGGNIVVNVPGIEPTGTLDITENGTYDVGSYAFASVQVGEVDTRFDDLVTGELTSAYGTMSTMRSFAFVQSPKLQTVEFPNLTEVPQSAFQNCVSLRTASFLAATSIGSSAFYGDGRLSSVYAPSVTCIGQSAFEGCTSFYGSTTVSSVKYSPDYKWAIGISGTLSGSVSLDSRCEIVCEGFLPSFSRFPNLTYIEGPGVKYVNDAAFGNYYGLSRLEVVDFPECISIGSSAFYNCSILGEHTPLDFPKCEYVGNQAFQNCKSLQTIGLSNCSYIGNQAFSGCSNLSRINLPSLESFTSSTFSGAYIKSYYLSVNSLPSSAFASNSGIEYIEDPNCSFMGYRAFYRCSNLSSISLPECISISGAAFSGCSNLTSVYFSKCEYVGPEAFYGCTNLSSVSLESCSYIGQNAFGMCKSLTTISLPACSYVSTYAFNGCSNLYSVSLPECSFIGSSAFNDCSIPELYLPACTSIGSSAFNGANINTLSLPILESISNQTFPFASIKNYVFDTLLSIPNSAFVQQNLGYGNSYIETITGATVYSIGLNAFGGCSNLNTVSFPSCINVDFSAFARCINLSSVYLPSCENLSNCAFQSCSSLLSISLPVCSNVGPNAFYDCTSIATVEIPECISIGSSAFWGCSNLSSVSLPVCSNVAYDAFYGCTNLTEISLPAVSAFHPDAFVGASFRSIYIGAYSLYDSSFSGCSSTLEIVELPSCSSIPRREFFTYSRLSSISLPSCTYVNELAFTGCSNLSSISLPVCSYIGDEAFGACTNLSTTSLPSCSYVGSGAFRNCVGLSSISLPVCSYMGYWGLSECTNLMSVYLLSSSVITLSFPSPFQGTPIEDSTYTGSFGSIFVPASLLTDYQTTYATLSERFAAFEE